jgi:hypothetical protein
MGGIYNFVGHADYYLLAAAAFWGLYCMIVVWTRVGQKRFRTEADQDVFLDRVEQHLRQGDYESVESVCEGDQRAVPMMVSLAVKNRDLEPEKLESWVMDRFQFDVLSDIDARVNWISTLIKASPMLGTDQEAAWGHPNGVGTYSLRTSHYRYAPYSDGGDQQPYPAARRTCSLWDESIL